MALASSARDSSSVLRDGDPQRRSEKVCACHRIDHRLCSHRHSDGRKRPHSCTAKTIATRHFSRFPFAQHRRFRLSPDRVCDTLTGQGLVASHAFGSRVDCSTGTGTARGGPGVVQRETHQSIQIPPPRSSVAPFLQPSLIASSSTGLQRRLISRPSSLSRNATGSDQVDAAGLAAERISVREAHFA